MYLFNAIIIFWFLVFNKSQTGKLTITKEINFESLITSFSRHKFIFAHATVYIKMTTIIFEGKAPFRLQF